MGKALEKVHAKYAASSSERWVECPASISLTEKAPPAKSSAYADEGTKAHEVLETILKAYISGTGPRRTAMNLERDYPKEMVEHALWAFKEIEKRMTPKINLFCEQKVFLPFIDEDFFGTLDISMVEEFSTLTIADYKYGAGIAVEPENNAQLISYALAELHKYDYNFDEVRILILQPRAFHEKGPIREWVTDVDTILSWGKKFKNAIEESKKVKPDIKAGSHCRFCPAAVICPEIGNKSLRQAQIEFDTAIDETPKLPEPEKIQIKNLGNILTACEYIESWIDKVREHAFHVLERGENVKGWKLVPKRSTRKWTDSTKTQKEALKAFGEDALSSPELLSPAQLEKIAGKEWVTERVTDVSSGLTLVQDSDKRQAINQLEKDFGSDKPKKTDNKVKTTKKLSKGK